MKLEWSQCAVEDRQNIFDFLEAGNPLAALAMDERISKQINRLIRFPESGRVGRVEGVRELVVNRTPYIVVYCIKGETLRLLRVLHGAQLWPDQLPDT